MADTGRDDALAEPAGMTADYAKEIFRAGARQEETNPRSGRRGENLCCGGDGCAHAHEPDIRTAAKLRQKPYNGELFWYQTAYLGPGW